MEGKRKIAFVVFLTGGITAIVANNVWVWLGEAYYFNGMAIGWLLMPLTIYLYVEERLFKSAALFIMSLAISNLIDELFFDPTKFAWNEYAGAVISLVVTFIDYKGWFKKVASSFSN